MSLRLYDPPVSEDGIQYNENYVLAKHYAKVTELCGLTVLSKAIHERIRQYELTGDWVTLPYKQSNIVKLGKNIIIGNNSFWTRESRDFIENDGKKIYIRFGLHERIIELLENWNFSKILEFNLENFVIEDSNISVLSDGSLFYIGYDSI